MLLYFVFGASLTAWLFSRHRWQKCKAQPVEQNVHRNGIPQKTPLPDRKIELAVWGAAKDFFGIVFFCAAIFTAFHIWLQLAVSDLPEMVIANVEFTAHTIRDKIKIFKVNPWLDGILIYLLLSLPLLLPAARYLNLSDRYQKFGKWVSKASQVFAVFTTFTFFGVVTKDNAEERADNLVRHNFQLIKDNKLIHAQLYSQIEDNIANAFLRLPEVEEALRRMESIDAVVEKAKADEDIRTYSLYHEGVIEKYLAALVHSQPLKDWPNAVASFDQAVGKEYAHLLPQSSGTSKPFTEMVKEMETEQFFTANEAWIKANVSEVSTKELQEALAFPSVAARSPYFEKYAPAAKKFFKAGYKTVVKEGLSKWLKASFAAYPFLEELVDIFIHDPVQDKLWQKVETCFKKGHASPGAITAASPGEAALPFIESIHEQRPRHAAQFSALLQEANQAGSAAEDKVAAYVQNIKQYNAAVEENYRSLLANNDYGTLASRYGRNSRPAYPGSLPDNSSIPSLDEWKNSLWQNRYHLHESQTQDLSSTFRELVARAEAEKTMQKISTEFADMAARQAARKSGFWKIFRKVVTRGH